MKKRIASIILSALLVLSFTACGRTGGNTPALPETEEGAAATAQDNESREAIKIVKLGFPGTQNFLTGIAGIAQENKYFDEELQKIGYKMEYVPFAAAGPAVNEALAGKKIDLAIYADFPGLVLKSKDIDISLLAVTDNYTNATFLVRKDSPIQTVQDLKGKKVAFTKGTFMQKQFLDILKLNGLSEKEVQVVNVLTTDAASALLTGNVDALIYVDTIIVPILADQSAREIETTRNHPDFRAQSVFVGVNAYVEENPEVPVAILKALLRAKEFVASNPQDSLKIWTKTGLNEEALKIVYGTDSTKYESYFPVEISQDAIAKLTATKEFLLEQKLITNDFSVEEFTNNSFYEKAIK